MIPNTVCPRVSHVNDDQWLFEQAASVFGFSDQVRHKPDFITTEDGKRFEIRIKVVMELFYLGSEAKR